MTKTTKSERKWGKDVEKVATKKRKGNINRDKKIPEEIDMYKILVDNSGFTKAMSYEDCIKVINEMESSASKLRRPLPSLIMVKQ
jgi:hypothetical protein